MSRHINPCRTCKPEDGRPDAGKFAPLRGFTRHDDRICAACRRYGPPQETPNYKGRAA